MCGGTVISFPEGRRKILLIKVSTLSCICPSAPDAAGPEPQSLSPPNEVPLCEAHESAALSLPLMFLHLLSCNRNLKGRGDAFVSQHMCAI